MKTQKLINLDDDIKSHIKNNVKIKNFSDWVNNTYRNQFMDKSIIEKRKKEIESELIELNNQLNNIDNVEYSILSQAEIEWIKKEVPSRLERNASDEGIYNYFINNFGIDINRTQFKKFIKKYVK